MLDLMTMSKVRQESLLEDAERCGMLQAATSPRLFERILLQFSDRLISAGTKLRERTLSEMPVLPVSQSCSRR